MRGGIAQLDPVIHRQRDGARFVSVIRVAMKIGSTGREQLQPGCHLAVPPDRIGVVIRVIHLNRVEACFCVRGNTRIDIGLSGVCK